MKKLLSILFILFCVNSLFAEKVYLLSDGHTFFHFSDDFSEFKYTNLDSYGIFSKTFKIIREENNKISFWLFNNEKYVYLCGNDYFILLNRTGSLTFIKDYSDYWIKNTEIVTMPEVSSYKKEKSVRYDEVNLLYIDFNPWISDSDNSGINESIVVKSDKSFNQFRIINGYVDIDNSDLFEKYNRVKALKVFDEDDYLIREYQIKDNSAIQSFKLPNSYNYVRFEISEIYDGTEYDDVAVTSLQMFAQN